MRRVLLCITAVFAVVTLSAAAVVFTPASRLATNVFETGGADTAVAGNAEPRKAHVASNAVVAAQTTTNASGNRWGGNYFPNVPVVTQDGQTLSFYNDVIKGRLVVISFIFFFGIVSYSGRRILRAIGYGDRPGSPPQSN